MKNMELDNLINFIKENIAFNDIEAITIIEEYYTVEKGGAIDAILHLNHGDKKTFRDFETTFIWNLQLLISAYFDVTSLDSNRWNKAEFTVYKDGRYEVKTWWDSEFQISLYGEDN